MRKSLFIGLVAALGLIGCTRNQEIDVPDANLSLFARTESPAESRTVVESGVHVYWEPGDEIAVFMGEKSAKFTTDITAASGTATFKGTFGDSEWPEEPDLWAVYPYSEDAVFDGETITTTLPSEQVARPGSFGKDMNLSIAHSNSSTLQFYNVGGGIRFSVTEEGIKKVIFEGLSGEIISGKVKIGLDENGKPEVKEVTGGSQFITLLPPSGQETFEPGAWYYIVAIPGALEGGYKLRFYKDSDYARRVSEKAVQIKRSIFGNIEKADEGIEYEATTTKFPETKEEIEASITLSESIGSQTSAIISKHTSKDGDIDLQTIVNEFRFIESVESAYVNSSGNTIIVKQTDGVYINILLNRLVDLVPNEGTIKVYTNVNKAKRSIDAPSGRSALILAPFQSSFKDKLDEITLYLESIGYAVSVFENEDADMSKFRGSFLKGFDVIYIATHGNAEGITADGQSTESYLLTGTKLHLLNSSFTNSYSDQIIVPNLYPARYAVTTQILDNIEFNNNFVLLGVCQSSGFAHSFYDKKAGIAIGFSEDIDNKLAVHYSRNLFYFLSMGGSVRNAHESYINLVVEEKPRWAAFMQNATHIYSQSDSPFVLFDPTPFNLHSEVTDSKVFLSWDINPSFEAALDYKVVIDDETVQIYEGLIDHGSFVFNTHFSGSFEWYVAGINGINEEYPSKKEYFTIYKTPDIKDLGLSVKWASFNLGATKPEDYGDYYAWGETEPYYHRLVPSPVWNDGKEAGYDWPSYKWCNGSSSSITKYNTSALTQLDPEDDAAHVNLGDKWRIPTEDEWAELRDNCSFTWTMQDGVNGFLVTSLKPGYTDVSIFLPAAGVVGNKSLYYLGESGLYWTAGNNTTTKENAGYNTFETGSSGLGYGWIDRCYGLSIRPVYDDQTHPITGDIEGTEEDPWN